MKSVVKFVRESEGTVINGVPRGSVLGPLLFIIHVNDLPSWIKNYMRIFADDTKICSITSELNDCARPQADLSLLHDWTHKWLLSFNPDKCKAIIAIL